VLTKALRKHVDEIDTWRSCQNGFIEIEEHIVQLNSRLIGVEKEGTTLIDKNFDVGYFITSYKFLFGQKQVARVNRLFKGTPNKSWRLEKFDGQTEKRIIIK